MKPLLLTVLLLSSCAQLQWATTPNGKAVLDTVAETSARISSISGISPKDKNLLTLADAIVNAAIVAKTPNDGLAAAAVAINNTAP